MGSSVIALTLFFPLLVLCMPLVYIAFVLHLYFHILHHLLDYRDPIDPTRISPNDAAPTTPRPTLS